VTIAGQDGIILLRLPTASLSASKTTLTSGQRTTLRASVSPVSGVAIGIEQRTAATPRWRRVATLATDAEGAALTARTPLVTTEYRAVCVGTGVRSRTVKVGVRPRLILRASRRSVRRGSRVTLSGTVSHPGRVTVSLQRYTGGRWRTVKRLRTRFGRYSTKVAFSKRGTFAYRVFIAADRSHLPAKSATVRIVVR
jgi:hypothetical protein